jgi:transcriptional regulator with XRE-family HTH domain
MPLDIRIRFGRALRRIREEQGINQEEAAERCGLHRTYYSGIERGVRNVSLVNIEKVGKGLKTKPAEAVRADLITTLRRKPENNLFHL